MLQAYGLNPVVHSLIIDGIFAGVGSVLSFLPVIVILFFFLSILEDTGYMARVAFVMELPNYRLPTLRNIGLLVLDKAKGFITKAFTVIFWATIIIWFLQTFDARLNVVAASDKSLLAAFGNVLLPIFRPLGITDWRISTAFLTGFMAKESVISTLIVLLGGNVDNLPLLFTPFTAFIFLIFSLLYTPCVAAIATVRRELGPAYALAVVAVQCIIAWLVSFAVYQIGEMFF